MKKALACTLSLVLLLSLTACHKPEQLDNSQPDNSAATSTQADVSTPEPDNTPPPEPPKAPAPEQLSDTTPTVPAKNEDPQDQAEPAAQEPTEMEPVKTETPKQTAPKTTDNPPAESKPAEQTQKSSSGGGLTEEDIKSLEEAGFKVSKPREKNEEAQSQQMPSAEEIENHLKETDPNYHVDKYGNVTQSAAAGDNKVGLD